MTSTNWGNYDNISLTNVSGYYTNASKSTGETDGFKSSKTLTTNSEIGSYVILTTGSTETVKKMNLYDVSGNLWEWTTEAAYINNSTYAGNINYNSYVLRGGGFDRSNADVAACVREFYFAPNTATNMGFRPALFLQ